MIPAFCVSTSLSTLQLVSLSYVSSIYPLVLCVITYCMIELHARGNWLLVNMWRPFNRLFYNKHSGINSSVIHNFGTFLMLSYGKNVFASFTLVQSYKLVKFDIANDTLKSLPRHSVDLGVPYFGATHAPYICSSGSVWRCSHCHPATSSSLDLPNSSVPKTYWMFWTEEMAHGTYIHGSVCRQL